MTDPDTPTTTASAPPRPWRPGRWLAGFAIALALLVATGYMVLGTQAALDYVIARAVYESEGRLTVEGAEGSLLSTIRVARIAWRGDGVEVEARETAVAWSPTDLFSRRFNVQGLGAKRLVLDFKPAPASGSRLPASLALPLEVEIRNVGVERIEWRSGARQGYVSGVSFNYRGGAVQHAIRDLRIVADDGTLTGNAEIGAMAPFPLRGTLTAVGDGPYRDARAELNVSDTLERIGVEANGTMRNARIAAKAILTPFAETPVASADIDARNVDIAQFERGWPSTLLTLKLAARPTAKGFSGTLEATNTAAGSIDAGRVPVESVTSRFSFEERTLTLTAIDARLPGGGSATGRVRVPLAQATVELALNLRGVDLSRVQTSLLATRLSGTLAAEVAEARQTIRGDLTQADIALAFTAAVEGKRITVERFRAQAGAGELAGSGRIDLAGARPFEVKASARKFDPSRFAQVPAGQLDGLIEARGTLAPSWDITVSANVNRGSRFDGLPVEGAARAHVTPTEARDIAVDARVATAAITLSGAWGIAAEKLAFTVNAPQLAALRPLLARYALVLVPDPLTGSLRANGTITGDRRSPGIDLTAHAERLQWGAGLRAATLDVKVSAAPGLRDNQAIALDARPLAVSVAGTMVAITGASAGTLRVDIDGSLANHRANLVASGEGFALTALLSGGLRMTKTAGGVEDPKWVGSIDRFSNRGTYPMQLDAPAVLEVARNRIHLGSARITVADGRADLTDLVIDDGRITTRGAFTGIPANALANLAGTPMPVASTLVIGGDWSLAATPRLNGRLTVQRERGDLFATESVTLDPNDLALGITVLELSANFVNDAITGTATLRSLRAGQADATLSLGAGPAPGHIATNAPLAASIKAELASLKPLQPWLGTLAVIDGRASVDITAGGTLAQPTLSGTMAGDALRFDLPQYGVHLKDGRLRAHLVERSLVLDDFSLAGGNGRFAAQGTLVRVAGETNTLGAAQVNWQAENFTLVNRPDLRLVADGKGTLKLAEGKLALAGNVDIGEGRVVYAAVTDGKLSDDVVIVGQPRRDATRGGIGDMPLTLDIDVGLGRDFRFSGEGLDTRLAGNVRVTTSPGGTLLAKGTINTVAGTYFIFGQRLDIDRGRLLFDGVAGNPALDVIALRKNLAVEAGVEITGTVRVPRVRLVSNPPVSDAEKLSWLITGQGLERATRSDLAALSAASASLLGGGQKPLTTQIANQVGLDDISFRETSTVPGGTSSQVVAFGKRISDRLTLVYEQGLTFASNALRIEYALSRTITLRAEAGAVSNLGIYYRRSYD